MLYTHILVATDFSEGANQALAFAFEEATQHGARLTLLHIMQQHATTEVYYVTQSPEAPIDFQADSGGTLPSYPTPEPTTVRRDPSEDVLEQLRHLVPSTFTGTWEARVTVGHPADAIVQTAEALPADLIVMGTHGRTGLQHVLLGSVAEKVVRHAPCPVLTVRHKQETD